MWEDLTLNFQEALLKTLFAYKRIECVIIQSLRWMRGSWRFTKTNALHRDGMPTYQRKDQGSSPHTGMGDAHKVDMQGQKSNLEDKYNS